ncbi:MAG: glycoside hydrolase family 15 protein [Thiohalocapsa sp.]|jgi:GH15 family glucan-1,4-alpha-glucosidase|uniref:glycoside hydrolase family 15 protein n=1 Tax=Thiohalocapsa sp. TaxID=2497641 RepID=UPI0025F2CCEC|nr:glycoside hydrolase family 15 protein [Thiohalocapsa sp.]MCG6943696.1 glycoside hydrolase family 15 protein [Thiohalocapsa sp.]
MALSIEDYALVGNTRGAALVGRDGSIDWLCLPRFDSPACFCALVGSAENGRWLIAPKGEVHHSKRRYRDGTLVLDTEIVTDSGRVRVTDCMPHWEGRHDVVRVVQGLDGHVPMRMELTIRFDYGAVVPWVRAIDGGIVATAGPDSLELRTQEQLEGEDYRTVCDFDVVAGQTSSFVLTYFPSEQTPPLPIDPLTACDMTTAWWRAWSQRSTYRGAYADAVERSLLTLKALTYSPTGGIIAAPTLGLPESWTGGRNFDFRYCWLRDATFTLYAFLISGYLDEARAWREWLLRVAAGRPQDLQILYGLAGERRLKESELEWLDGYQDIAPVLIGNAAHSQRQLDVYGEIFDALHLARRSGIEPQEHVWALQRALLDFLETAWQEPDDGIWEIRGPNRHFTHSKVMAWVAFDRAVKAVERFGRSGPAERWAGIRDTIHDEVCRRGVDPDRNVFVQEYGGKALDASLLMVPLVGFLPPDDPRVIATMEAVEQELTWNGFVMRYAQGSDVDGIGIDEGTFLPCSFWLVDNLAMTGRRDDACRLFERLLEVRNDVGLLSEEYDPEKGRLMGNFPLAFTHVALINSARNLSRAGGPGEHRAADDESADGPS